MLLMRNTLCCPVFFPDFQIFSLAFFIKCWITIVASETFFQKFVFLLAFYHHKKTCVFATFGKVSEGWKAELELGGIRSAKLQVASSRQSAEVAAVLHSNHCATTHK
uniref:Uncharacterized protein n=1 Tax=Micrurus surinamensis TaxID=129470 RepID=A0A2D4PS51_MICSU